MTSNGERKRPIWKWVRWLAAALAVAWVRWLAAALAVAGIIYLLVWYVPAELARRNANASVESAWISAVAGFLGVVATAAVAVAAFWYSRATNRATITAAETSTNQTVKAALDTNKATIDAAREAQFPERYGKAIEQLGSDNRNVRIGGIYALERVALDSPRDHPTVMEVLAAFIREYSREQSPVLESADTPAQKRRIRSDVQAALTVIGRRDTRHDRRPIDLAGTDLTRADLAGADLTGADLAGADLTDADLTAADLTAANLPSAILTGARFTINWHIEKPPGAKEPETLLIPASWIKHERAKLHGAKLYDADLTGTDLSGADLTDANLNRANLTGAHFGYADLTGAQLIGADLTDSWFNDAKLHRTVLDGAKIHGANFRDADLTQSFLSGLDFTGVYHRGADFTEAHHPKDPQAGPHYEVVNTASRNMPVPKGWVRDLHSDHLRRTSEDTDDTG